VPASAIRENSQFEFSPTASFDPPVPQGPLNPYRGGNGNDVVLTAMPELSTLLALVAGLLALACRRR